MVALFLRIFGQEVFPKYNEAIIIVKKGGRADTLNVQFGESLKTTTSSTQNIAAALAICPAR